MVQVFLGSFLKLDDKCEKAKAFEIVKSRKIRGNVDTPFGFKRTFSYAKNPATLLAQNNLRTTFYRTLAKYLKTHR